MQPPNDRSAGDQDSSPEQTAQALLNLRCAVDHCHDAIIITDPAGRIEFVNLAFESLTGLSVQDSVGKNFASLAGAQTSASNSVLDTVLQRGFITKLQNCGGKMAARFHSNAPLLPSGTAMAQLQTWSTPEGSSHKNARFSRNLRKPEIFRPSRPLQAAPTMTLIIS